jgi:O-antigen/teichoic acid export membrane protein
MQRSEAARPEQSQAPAMPPPGLSVNASWRLASTVARALIGLISVPIFIKMLGMSQWGLLALFQAATSPLVLLDFGFGAAAVKYVAESVGRGDPQGAVRVVHTTLIVNLAMACTGVIGLNLASPWLATSLFAIPAADVATASLGFKLISVNWAIGVVTLSYAGVLSAHQKFDWNSRLAVMAVAWSTGLSLLAAFLTHDIIALLWAQIVVGAGLGLIYYRRAVRLLPGIAGTPRWDAGSFRRSASFGIWQVIAMAGSFLSGWGDRYILGAYFAPAILGFYALASILYTQLYGMFLEMAEVLFPAVSHLEGRGDLVQARRLSLLVGWSITNAFGIGAAVLAIVGRDFIHLWISSEAASQAGTPLRNLCVAGIVGMAAIAPFYYLLGIGKTRWDAAASTVLGVTVVGVGLALIPRYGLVAVGYGLLAGLLARWGVLALIWREHFSVDVPLGRFAMYVWAPAISAVCIALVGSRIHELTPHAATWKRLVVETLLVAMGATVVQLGMNELLPGGAQRRREVVSSLKPVVVRLVGLGK